MKLTLRFDNQTIEQVRFCYIIRVLALSGLFRRSRSFKNQIKTTLNHSQKSIKYPFMAKNRSKINNYCIWTSFPTLSKSIKISSPKFELCSRQFWLRIFSRFPIILLFFSFSLSQMYVCMRCGYELVVFISEYKKSEVFYRRQFLENEKR